MLIKVEGKIGNAKTQRKGEIQLFGLLVQQQQKNRGKP